MCNFLITCAIFTKKKCYFVSFLQHFVRFARLITQKKEVIIYSSFANSTFNEVKGVKGVKHLTAGTACNSK